MNIQYSSELSDFQLNNPENTTTWIKEAIQAEGKDLGDLLIHFVDNKTILEINRQFLNHSYFTDIITFNYNFLDVLSGEIFISIEAVRENAGKCKGKTFLRELYRVIIHGILHLLGYQDATDDEKELMRKKEDQQLTYLDWL